MRCTARSLRNGLGMRRQAPSSSLFHWAELRSCCSLILRTSGLDSDRLAISTEYFPRIGRTLSTADIALALRGVAGVRERAARPVCARARVAVVSRSKGWDCKRNGHEVYNKGLASLGAARRWVRGPRRGEGTAEGPSLRHPGTSCVPFLL